jgi:DNA-binding GntR family transcriptional regulator
LKSIQDSLGVSSSPIREALTRLSEAGLIIYQPNVGMTVLDITYEDAVEIFSLAEEFDVIALKFAFNSEYRNEMLIELNHVQKKAAEALEKHDLEKWMHYSDEFHNVILKYCNNSRLFDAAEKNRMQLSILSHKYQQIDENNLEIQEEHNEILRALESGNLKMAEKCMRMHLQSSANKSLKLLKNKQ